MTSQDLWLWYPVGIASNFCHTVVHFCSPVILLLLGQKSHKCTLKVQNSGKWPRMRTGKREYGTLAGSCAPSTTHPETSGKMGSSRCSFVWVRGKPGRHPNLPNMCRCHSLLINYKARWTAQSMLECLPGEQFNESWNSIISILL